MKKKDVFWWTTLICIYCHNCQNYIFDETIPLLPRIINVYTIKYRALFLILHFVTANFTLECRQCFLPTSNRLILLIDLILCSWTFISRNGNSRSTSSRNVNLRPKIWKIGFFIFCKTLIWCLKVSPSHRLLLLRTKG